MSNKLNLRIVKERQRRREMEEMQDIVDQGIGAIYEYARRWSEEDGLSVPMFKVRPS